MCGHQAMEVEVKTAAAVMVTPTAFTLCPSAQPLNTAPPHGTQSPVRQPLLPPSAVEVAT